MRKDKQRIQHDYTPCAAGEPLPVRSAVLTVAVFLLILTAQAVLARRAGTDGAVSHPNLTQQWAQRTAP